MLIKSCLIICNQDTCETSQFLGSISLDRTMVCDTSINYLNPVSKNFLPQLIIGAVSLVSLEMFKKWKWQVGEPSEIIAVSDNVDDAEKYMSVDYISSFCLIPVLDKNYAALLNKTINRLVCLNLQSVDRQLVFLSGPKVVELNLDSVLYIEEMGKRVRIVTSDNHYDTDEPYYNLCFQLAGFSFLRISATMAINLSKIDSASASFVVVGGREIEISGQYQSKLIRVFEILFQVDLLSL
jgi:hypothetical protein